MMRGCLLVLLMALLLVPTSHGYPLDGIDASGIARLAGDGSRPQPAGARWATDEIRLRLVDRPGFEFDEVPEDAVLKQRLSALLAKRDSSYGVVLVDFSDPRRIRWAGVREDLKQNPGSVGKIVTMLALFQTLADVFPDVGERRRLLKETVVRAGDWALGDEHAVPKFDPVTGKNSHARLRTADEFTLSEWLDHAVSASANGAGSVVWRETMLLRQFGRDYPPSAAAAATYFTATPKKELSAAARALVEDALRRADLNPGALMQGSFWTRAGKAHVPGGGSYATPRELARFMIRLEQGRLVDTWSSLEMKRYLYVTKRRYRYVYAPELATAGVFFKSGSLYQCLPEEGYRCGKYLGNKRNMMNSVATIERTETKGERTWYTVALMSNVLKVNSAWDHSRIAAALDALVRTSADVRLREEATEQELRESGRSE